MPSHKMFIPALVLTVICLATTALLSLTYELTRTRRAEQQEAAANANRLALYPAAAAFEPALPADTVLPEGILEATCVLDASGECVGYIIVAARRGYGGQVPVMAGISPDGTIEGVRVLANDETPGLGKKVEAASFLAQFTGQAASQPFALTVDKASTQPIDAIAGATISSRAVTEAINAAARLFVDLDKEGQ